MNNANAGESFRDYLTRIAGDERMTNDMFEYLSDWISVAAAWESVSRGNAIESSGVMLHNRLQWWVYPVPGHTRIEIQIPR